MVYDRDEGGLAEVETLDVEFIENEFLSWGQVRGNFKLYEQEESDVVRDTDHVGEDR